MPTPPGHPSTTIHPIAATGATLMSFCLMISASVQADEESKVVHTVDFSGNHGKKAPEWLKESGYRLARDADDEDRLAFSFNSTSLIIETKRKAFGFAMKEVPELQARKVRIIWGVDRYPVGASWEKGLKREALMLFLFYGKERIRSGSLFLPNIPYYAGLFLSDVDTKDKVYIGNNYTHCGRYVCLANPKPGETVTSEFELDAFKGMFGKDKTPALSGFSLEVDTSGTADGLSKAFVSRIEFLN